jgi:hypothetical protein
LPRFLVEDQRRHQRQVAVEPVEEGELLGRTVR